MQRKKYPNIKYHIICEDIRHEIGNKVSLMGVFQRNIRIPMPFSFPKLCFRVVFSDIPESKTIAARLYDPDQNILHKARIDLPEKPEGDVNALTLDLAFSGLQIEKAGKYSLSFSFDKDRGKKTIDFTIVEVADESV